jgi:hypothetical protein
MTARGRGARTATRIINYLNIGNLNRGKLASEAVLNIHNRWCGPSELGGTHLYAIAQLLEEFLLKF